MSKIYPKGSLKYATEVLYANNNTLYLDSSFNKQLTPQYAAKLTPAQAVLSSNNAYLPLESMAVDGTSMKFNNVVYNITNAQ